ncbi:MAG: DUF4333 domain-containing protein [Gordonia sp. (in: high G+C Gram-positive bacteria)]|uniref:hypothetical protein n=1 Tax=Gordonia sp. (in: high G+C Gram-positive bacteria) TaxID=84139 RepID=UPI003BB7FB44
MMKTNLLRGAILAGAAVAAVSLVGCSSDDGASDVATPAHEDGHTHGAAADSGAAAEKLDKAQLQFRVAMSWNDADGPRPTLVYCKDGMELGAGQSQDCAGEFDGAWLPITLTGTDGGYTVKVGTEAIADLAEYQALPAG